jgi:lipocalin
MNRIRTLFRSVLAALVAAVCGGCTGIPENVKAVEPSDAQRCVGTWYEIARLPNCLRKGWRRFPQSTRCEAMVESMSSITAMTR